MGTDQVKPGGAGFGQRRFVVRDKIFADETATIARRRLYAANGDRPLLRNRWPDSHVRVDPERKGGWSRFQSYETSNGYVSMADTDGDAFHFSGVPDHIEIFVLDNDAVVSFVDETGQAQDEISIAANNFYSPRIRAPRVRARNATAGLTARIQVVGKWDSRS